MSNPHPPSVSVADLPDEPGTETVLLDVREDDEWVQGHAPGALHIPMADVPARLDEINLDAELYVICRQGGRSIAVAQYLNQIGIEAVNVSGGMVAWQKAGKPLVCDGDAEAKIY
ncbi:rhodanese-like domain-containing protein [Skermania sp. ID1734]|uniref:rhodanese-like domain-containing protein n=1 Tax=Skermania sp. ID1734 TaxID=2597516 RepID=UPI0011801714|nr:rhodanese-like domain-containing protein [Skermania sp. ID1734]TSE00795.1 rhodanese-like domain-containing protein [Skermania sp. ID1734]